MNEVATRVRKRLAEELEKVSHAVVQIQCGIRHQEMETVGDNTPLSEVTDAVQVTEEREITTQRLDALVNRSVELRHALGRIDQGTYGVCERCDEFIHPERLMAVPEASFCAPCQARIEARPGRRYVTGSGWKETGFAPRVGTRPD